MSKVVNQFYVPSLKKAGAWVELRDDSKGAKDWRGYRSLAGIRKIAGHHTVTHRTGNAAKEVEVIRQIHMGSKGWAGIGYNFIITSQTTKDGQYAVVYMIGDIGSIRAHAPNTKGAYGLKAGHGNEYMIGVSVIGMNHLHDLTDAQYRSYHELLKELIYNENTRLPHLKSWSDWQPHWAFDATACYGSKLNRNKVITPPPFKTAPPSETCEQKIKKAVDANTKSLNTAHATEVKKLKSSHQAELKKLQGLIQRADEEHKRLSGELQQAQNAREASEGIISKVRASASFEGAAEDLAGHIEKIVKQNKELNTSNKKKADYIDSLKSIFDGSLSDTEFYADLIDYKADCDKEPEVPELTALDHLGAILGIFVDWVNKFRGK